MQSSSSINSSRGGGAGGGEEEEEDEYGDDQFEAPSPDGKAGTAPRLYDSPTRPTVIDDQGATSSPTQSKTASSGQQDHSVAGGSSPTASAEQPAAPVTGGTYMRGKWVPAGSSTNATPKGSGSPSAGQGSGPQSPTQNHSAGPEIKTIASAAASPEGSIGATSKQGVVATTIAPSLQRAVSAGSESNNHANDNDDDYGDGFFDSPSKPATADVRSAVTSPPADAKKSTVAPVLENKESSIPIHRPQSTDGGVADVRVASREAPPRSESPPSAAAGGQLTGPSRIDAPQQIASHSVDANDYYDDDDDGFFGSSESKPPKISNVPSDPQSLVDDQDHGALAVPLHILDVPSRPDAAPSGEALMSTSTTSQVPQGRSARKRDDDGDVFGGVDPAAPVEKAKAIAYVHPSRDEDVLFDTHENHSVPVQKTVSYAKNEVQSEIQYADDDAYEESFEGGGAGASRDQKDGPANNKLTSSGDNSSATTGRVSSPKMNPTLLAVEPVIMPSNSNSQNLAAAVRKTPEVLRRPKGVRSAKSGASRRSDDSYNDDDFENYEEYEEALDDEVEAGVVETSVPQTPHIEDEPVKKDNDENFKLRIVSSHVADDRLSPAVVSPGVDLLASHRMNVAVDAESPTHAANNNDGSSSSSPDSPALASDNIPFSPKFKEKKQRFANEIYEHQRSRQPRAQSGGRFEGDYYHHEGGSKPASRQKIPQAARRASTIDPEILKLQKKIEIIKYGKKSAAQAAKVDSDVVDDVRNKLVRELEEAKRKYIEYCRNVGHPDGRLELELREMGLSASVVNPDGKDAPPSPLRKPRVPTARSAGRNKSARSNRERSESPKKPWGAADPRPVPPGRVIVHNSRSLAVSSGLNIGALSLHDESSFATASEVEEFVDVPAELESESNVDLSRLPVFFALDQPRSVYRRPKKKKGPENSIELTPSKKPPLVRNSRFVVAPSSWVQPRAAPKMAFYSVLSHPSQQSQILEDDSQFVGDSSISASLHQGDASVDMYLPSQVASIALTPSMLQEQMHSASHMYRMGQPVSLVDGESIVDGSVRDGHVQRMHHLMGILKPDAPMQQPRVVVRRPKVTKPKSGVKKKRIQGGESKPNPLSEREEKERQIRELRLSIARQSLSTSEFELRERKRREMEERRLNFFENLEAKKKLERELKNADKMERQLQEEKRRGDRGVWAGPSVGSSDGVSENSPTNGTNSLNSPNSRRGKLDCGPFKRNKTASKGKKGKGSKKQDSDSDDDDISALLGLDLPKRKAATESSDEKSKRLMEAVAAAKAAALMNVPYDDQGPVHAGDKPNSQPMIIMMNKSNPSPRLQKYVGSGAHAATGRSGAQTSEISFAQSSQQFVQQPGSKARGGGGYRSVPGASGKQGSADWIMHALNAGPGVPNLSDEDDEAGGGGSGYTQQPRSRQRKNNPQQRRGPSRASSGDRRRHSKMGARGGPESSDANDSDSSFGSRGSQHQYTESNYSHKSRRASSTPSIDEREVTPSGQFYHIAMTGAAPTMAAAPPKQPAPSQRRQSSNGRSIRDPASGPSGEGGEEGAGRMGAMSAGMNIDGFYASVARRAAEGVPSGSAGVPATTPDTEAFYKSIHNQFRQTLE